ncbi:MAG: 3-hydroxyacyl-ACP dehydratase FabZ family protein [Tepidisphaerales bacterium]
MPPALLFDLSGIDLNRVLYDREAIRQVNLQRYEFEMLDGICWVDEPAGRIVGFKDVRADEFWVRGHIPGRPLFPGALQIEAAAQISSFFTTKVMGWQGFLGFGGVDEVRFRGQVVPGQRLYLLAERQWARHRRVQCKTQGLVDGQLVFEGLITGVLL